MARLDETYQDKGEGVDARQSQLANLMRGLSPRRRRARALPLAQGGSRGLPAPARPAAPRQPAGHPRRQGPARPTRSSPTTARNTATREDCRRRIRRAAASAPGRRHPSAEAEPLHPGARRGPSRRTRAPDRRAARSASTTRRTPSSSARWSPRSTASALPRSMGSLENAVLLRFYEACVNEALNETTYTAGEAGLALLSFRRPGGRRRLASMATTSRRPACCRPSPRTWSDFPLSEERFAAIKDRLVRGAGEFSRAPTPG